VSLARALFASLALASCAFAAPAEPAAQRDFVLVAGAVYSGDTVHRPGVLVVRDGKVADVFKRGARPLPTDLPLISRPHLCVAPGFVLARLTPYAGRRDESSLGARFNAVDAYDPYRPVARYLEQGITTAFWHPGRGRLVTGRGGVVKLGGPAAGRILVADGALCAHLDEGALAPPPSGDIPTPSSSDVQIVPFTPQRPSSRAGLVPELRRQIQAALAYDKAREAAGADRPGFDADLEQLAAAVLSGRMRLGARRTAQIRAALELAKDLELKLVLEGASEAHRLAPQLAAAGVPVVYEVGTDLRRDERDRGTHPDRLNVRADTPRRLNDAGVRFALVPPAGSELELRLAAGHAIRGGLSPQRAFEAITSRAADVLQVGKRVGRLTAGYDADFVLLNGAPWSSESHVLETWIDGRRVYQAPEARAVVVRAGTILTAAGHTIRDGAVLVQDGQIAAVGSQVAVPRGARVIDAGPHAVVTPGFVDAYGHVGLHFDRSAPKPNVPIHAVIAREDEALLRVARAGVTTVGLAPWALNAQGSRVAAVKTAEWDADDLRRGLIVKEAAGMAFDLSRDDPANAARGVIGRIKAARAYAQKWAKYEEALAKWREKQAAEQPAEEPEPVEEESEEEQKPDPISGTWSFTISGDPLPEPQSGEMKVALQSDKRTLKGVASVPGSPDSELEGTLEGTTVTLEIKAPVESPFGNPVITAELDAEDHLGGSLKVGPFEVNFEASRTERSMPEIKLNLKRKRGGRPPAPPVDAGLEPLREALAGDAVVVLRVSDLAVARAALGALAEEEADLKLMLVGLSEADRIAAEVKAHALGVALAPEGLINRGGVETSPPTLAASAEIPLAFYSDAEDGAAELPWRGVLAVQRGLSPGHALAALTRQPARMLGIDDRVGSLEVGKDGDLLVWSGPPFAAESRLEAVIVGGRILEEEVE